MWEAVLQEYTRNGYSVDDAYHQSRLARILREGEYDYKNKNLNYGVINMNTTEILQKTEKLVNDIEQNSRYKIKNHENIARLWSSYLQNKTQLNIISPKILHSL